MASGVIKKPNNRTIKYFDVQVPAGSSYYNFSSDVPSDYSSDNRLGACSIGGTGVLITQLGATILFFSAATSAVTQIRIHYYTN
jgi:hypothetical protein